MVAFFTLTNVEVSANKINGIDIERTRYYKVQVPAVLREYAPHSTVCMLDDTIICISNADPPAANRGAGCGGRQSLPDSCNNDDDTKKMPSPHRLSEISDESCGPILGVFFTSF